MLAIILTLFIVSSTAADPSGNSKAIREKGGGKGVSGGQEEGKGSHKRGRRVRRCAVQGGGREEGLPEGAKPGEEDCKGRGPGGRGYGGGNSKPEEVQ